MPFRFAYVCDLLQRLEDNQRARSGVRPNAEIIRDWFRTHQALILREDQDATALLSTLLPEKRTDRVYFIKEKRLQTIIGRGLGLGRSRIQQLGRWQEPRSGVDLAECVESILMETVSWRS
jgi:DNA ligase 4